MAGGVHYVGQIDLSDLLGPGVPRYFYGLRRTDNGELYLGKVDQLRADDQVSINNIGGTDENMPDFDVGIDFYEGRDVNHTLVFDNLNYEQYRWDGRDLFYYINDAGELVIRINEGYQYPTGI